MFSESFVNSSKINLNNPKEVEAAVYLSSKRTFGNWLISISNVTRGKAYGLLTIMYPDYSERNITFKGEITFRGLAHFRVSMEKDINDFYSVPVYYYSKCFNLIQNAQGVSYDNVKFIPDNKSGEIHEKIISNIFRENRDIFIEKIENVNLYTQNLQLQLSKYLTIDVSKLSELDSNSKLRSIAIHFLTVKTFGEILLHSKYIRSGTLSGIGEVFQADGTYKTIVFNNHPGYEVLIKLHNPNINLQYEEYLIYLCKSCFNIIRISNENSNVTFSYQSRYNVTISYSPNLFNKFPNKIKKSKNEEISITKNKISEYFTIDQNSEKLFWSFVRKNQTDYFFDSSKVDHNNTHKVEAAINIASRRAYKNLFIGCESTRRGKAYGVMEVFYPNQTSLNITFNGEEVYEGTCKFRRNAEVIENTENLIDDYIIMTVYYYSKCFNPIRNANGADRSNVTFITENDVVKMNINYPNFLIDEIKKTKIFIYNYELIAQDYSKLYGIVDISGSMRSIINKVETEVNDFNFERLIKHDGCDFTNSNPRRQSMYSIIMDIISLYTAKDEFLIYIFADFEDSIDPNAIKTLGSSLQGKNISLILYSYDRQIIPVLNRLVYSTPKGFITYKPLK